MDKKQADSIIRETRDNYNIIASEWDQSRVRPSAVKLKMLGRGEKILDLGCGNGLLIPVALKKYQSYTGLDISRALLKIAKNKYREEIRQGRVNLVAGDARKLPFKDQEFDGVMGYAVLHHLPGTENQARVLKEIWRVLKPGGVGVLINWNLLNPWCARRFAVKQQLKKIPTGWGKGDVSVPWKATGDKKISRFVHIFTAWELRDLARAAGFKNPRVAYYNRAGELIKNGEEMVLRVIKSIKPATLSMARRGMSPSGEEAGI